MEQTAKLGLELIQSHEYDRAFLAQDKLDIRGKTRTSAFPWRGQFSPEFIEALLESYAPAGARILDPFVGSGTVLFESAKQGHASAGVEINPAAFELSYLASMSSETEHERRRVYLKMLDALSPALAIQSLSIAEEEGRETILRALRAGRDANAKHAIRVAIMLAMGNGSDLKKEKLIKSVASIRQILDSLPVTPVPTSAQIGDARSMNFNDEEFDLTITSPPYINVFNYHQNYRPAVEIIGYQPLGAARSEIGSNRSNRQNRFLTVIQYCLDMQLVLTEVARVTKDGGALVLIVGKESKVRGIPFANANLLGAIATKSGHYQLVRKQQRKFTNRFGKSIYEDVLTLKHKKSHKHTVDLSLGRAVAKVALQKAWAESERDIKEDIGRAVDAIELVAPSKLAQDGTQNQMNTAV